MLGFMSSKAAQELLRKATRRQEYSAATKRALIEVAIDLFARRGYAGANLDEIVAGARVTKGALYHHFRGKQELFEAAFSAVEDTACDRIRSAINGVRDPWEQAVTGLREFLTIARSDEYRRIVIQEGPAVLGYERFREQEQLHTFGLVQEIITALVQGYDVAVSTVEALTRLFFGALSSTGMAVSTAEDAERASEDAEDAIVLLLAGIRSVLETRDRLPTAEELAPRLSG